MNTTANGWNATPIRDVCEGIIDCVNKTAPTVEYATPFKMIRTTNVRDGWINLDEVRCVVADTFARWNRRATPRKGDVILTREAPLGEVGMLRGNEQVFLGQRLVLYRANPAVLDNRFLLYSFQEAFLQGQIKSLGSGATVEHMRVPDAEKLLIRLPSLPVQQRIASILSAYDDLIENNTRRIKILEEMAQMIYREWFVHFRFPDHENVRMVESELGLIPEGWRVGRLDDALVLQRGFDLPTSQRIPSNVPIIAATGLNGMHNVAKVKGPGVVTGRSGSLGTVMLVWEDFWPLNTALWVKEFRQSSPIHAYFTLQALDLKGFNSGAAVPTLNRNDIHGLRTVLPDSKILNDFTESAVPLFMLKRNLEAKNLNLRHTRDFLLPKLISGEVSVEAAAELMEQTA